MNASPGYFFQSVTGSTFVQQLFFHCYQELVQKLLIIRLYSDASISSEEDTRQRQIPNMNFASFPVDLITFETGNHYNQFPPDMMFVGFRFIPAGPTSIAGPVTFHLIVFWHR